MPAALPRPPRRPRRKFPPLARVPQLSESHCGPAVVQILLARLGVVVDQERLTLLAGALETIAEHGTRVDQLALAVARLNAPVRLWYKFEATLDDLLTVVVQQRYPAGVEWQGLFEESEADETAEGDYGHYSIVRRIDRRRGLVTILDPYQDFYAEDRIFPLDFFLRRWWDTNEIPDPHTGQPRLVEDHHCLFVVTPLRVRFPARLGMRGT